jgi:protein TonB
MKPTESRGLPFLDDPRIRMLWIAPLASLVWFGILSLFAILMAHESKPSALIPLQARIIELAPAGGKGQPGAAVSSVPPAGAVRSLPHPSSLPAPRLHHNPIHHHLAPPVTTHPPTTPKRQSQAEAPTAHEPVAAGAARGATTQTRSGSSGASAAGSGAGAGSGSGIGSGNGGARAIYAPAPVLPDDLRENPINTVAIAHFIVEADGTVTVTLAKPTENPELNAILLDTLKRWRFFPATNHGAPVASQFDLRIPITVQ